jgi:aryl-alcohol dehydrogenase-like predicted oxidoreductase
MKYARLGATGLEVSRIAFGCMSIGVPGERRPWTLGEDEARPLFRRAWDAGINFFDTANSYSGGSSEEVTGKLIKELAPREEIVLASKVFNRMRPGPNGAGLSRKAIFAQLDASLKRLDTDYLDLYQIHRWDHQTPIEETLDALNDTIKAGKVRYIGASSMYAWQFAKALYTADLHGWPRFVSMQDQVNLVYREEEREMLPLCIDQGVGVIPWGPLGSGKLTRPWGAQTKRNTTDANGRTMYATDVGNQRGVVEAVGKVAAARGLSYAQVAMAWLLAKPGITAPILGSTSVAHLDDAIAAVEVTLARDEIEELEAPYQARPVVANL